jgi:DNA-binding response OmpR family regulator
MCHLNPAMGSLPALIVLDMHLPGTDGKHILAQIRANDRLKGVRRGDCHG